MSEHDLFLVHLVATAYMVGVIWFVQIVHYPLMLEVGDAAFCRYSRLHQSRTSYVVGPPMLIEALSGLALIAWSPILRTSPAFYVSLALLTLVWLSTAFWQVPLHKSFLQSCDRNAVERLVRTNWIRTIAWTGRAALIVGIGLGDFARG
ncbi:MAG: hypothetical protein JNL96_14085 [Planctomycetaceae bacterium]|nr:hypothetical protein [Planctomycetaceae bacterium]